MILGQVQSGTVYMQLRQQLLFSFSPTIFLPHHLELHLSFSTAQQTVTLLIFTGF
jgi:hypothetical protein